MESPLVLRLRGLTAGMEFRTVKGVRSILDIVCLNLDAVEAAVRHHKAVQEAEGGPGEKA